MKTEFDWEDRQKQLCDLMKKEGIDCLFQTPSVNLGYLTGQMLMQDERLNLYILTVDGRKAAFANEVYKTEVEEWDVPAKRYWKDGQTPWPALREFLEQQGIRPGKVMVDGTMASRFAFPLREALPETEFVLADSLYTHMRSRKDEQEHEAMRTSCRLCSDALSRVLERGRAIIGMTERQFHDILCQEMADAGIQNPGGMVCVGENAALPHYTGSDGVITEGKCLMVDFGGTWKGYWSDMTRTFFVGTPSEEFRKVYDTVHGALLAGHAAARPGNVMENVDKAVRDYIAERGYGEYFTHRTGHGIGLDVHEQPCAAWGEKTVAQPGMAFSIEPGIYLPGKFGIRIEDQAFLTEDGVEILHPFPRELMTL